MRLLIRICSVLSWIFVVRMVYWLLLPYSVGAFASPAWVSSFFGALEFYSLFAVLLLVPFGLYCIWKRRVRQGLFFVLVPVVYYSVTWLWYIYCFKS